ncbi:hypothetical protein PGR6_07060 [Pseudomonas sp. GR 6-02]|nr:hypothetical protein PGR6_07060 [Pseudomonas sp. GR 6-02]
MIFLGRVPATGEVNDVVGCLHVHPKPDSDGRQNDDCETRQFLELVDQPLPAMGLMSFIGGYFKASLMKWYSNRYSRNKTNRLFSIKFK